MSYRLTRRGSIAREVKRVVDRQLALAVDELRAVGDRRSDDAVHGARRHVKKVRAVLRLVQPTLGNAYDAANRNMRLANRLLAPIADGRAVVDTIARLRRKYGTRLNRRTLTGLRTVLVERVERIDRKAELDRVLPIVANVLRAERTGVAAWTLDAPGFRAIAPGLERSIRRGRRAMAQATLQPTADHYHVWRRRVKDLWFQVRLLEGRCENQLLEDQRRLEALDGCLGEYHNVILLEHVLMAEALVSRQQTARALQLLRRYQTQLRRRALLLGRGLFAEKPRHFVRRIKRLWQPSGNANAAPEKRATRQRAA